MGFQNNASTEENKKTIICNIKKKYLEIISKKKIKWNWCFLWIPKTWICCLFISYFLWIECFFFLRLQKLFVVVYKCMVSVYRLCELSHSIPSFIHLFEALGFSNICLKMAVVYIICYFFHLCSRINKNNKCSIRFVLGIFFFFQTFRVRRFCLFDLFLVFVRS